MLVLQEKQLVFVHVYKTGGTSLRQILTPLAHPDYSNIITHATALELRNHLPQEVHNFHWFTTIRNPFEINVSLWKFIATFESHPDHATVKEQSFEQFLAWLQEVGWQRWQPGMQWQIVNAPRRPRYLTISNFLCDEEGNLLVDRVMRQESFAEDYRLLSKDYDLPKELPHLNVTQHDSYRDYYSPTSKALIEHHHADDLEKFNYSF